MSAPIFLALPENYKEFFSVQQLAKVISLDEHGLRRFEITSKDLFPTDPVGLQLIKIRYLLLEAERRGEYEELKDFIHQKDVPMERIIQAFGLNKQSQIISQTINLILDYQGTRGILRGMTPLPAKRLEEVLTKEDLERVLYILFGEKGREISEEDFKEQNLRIFSHDGKKLIIPLVFDIILSACRGSGKKDSVNAQFLTYDIIYAIVTYASKGGYIQDEESGPQGPMAVHEVDLGLRMIDQREDKEIDEKDVPLAFYYIRAISEYMRKRTMGIKENTIAGHIQQFLEWQLKERRAKQNIYKILRGMGIDREGEFSKGILTREGIKSAVGKLNDQLQVLSSYEECGLNDNYYDAIFGYLDDQFFAELEKQYEPNKNNRTLLEKLLKEAMGRIRVLAVLARNGNPDVFIDEHPWITENKTLLDYLENEIRVRAGTFDDMDVSTVELKDGVIVERASDSAMLTSFNEGLTSQMLQRDPHDIDRGRRKIAGMNRREFIKKAALGIGTVLLTATCPGCESSNAILDVDEEPPESILKGLIEPGMDSKVAQWLANFEADMSSYTDGRDTSRDRFSADEVRQAFIDTISTMFQWASNRPEHTINILRHMRSMVFATNFPHGPPIQSGALSYASGEPILLFNPVFLNTLSTPEELRFFLITTIPHEAVHARDHSEAKAGTAPFSSDDRRYIAWTESQGHAESDWWERTWADHVTGAEYSGRWAWTSLHFADRDISGNKYLGLFVKSATVGMGKVLGKIENIDIWLPGLKAFDDYLIEGLRKKGLTQDIRTEYSDLVAEYEGGKFKGTIVLHFFINGEHLFARFSLSKDGLKLVDRVLSLDTMEYLDVELPETIYTPERISEEKKNNDEAILVDPVGGIDLNPDKLKLQIQGEGIELNFPLDTQEMQNIKIDGLSPMIINITPVTNLPDFLSP